MAVDTSSAARSPRSRSTSSAYRSAGRHRGAGGNREYPAALTDASAAVRTSLADLQFPPPTEKSDGGEVTFETKASDGARVHVYLESLTSRIPGDGPVTRITVRVGAFGDDAVSARILDQISIHLVVPPASQAASAAPPVPRPSPPHPPETSPPPLAAATTAATK